MELSYSKSLCHRDERERGREREYCLLGYCRNTLIDICLICYGLESINLKHYKFINDYRVELIVSTVKYIAKYFGNFTELFLICFVYNK